MSTRAIIARPRGDGFVGRYHHWDGYPTGLGAALWELANTQFKGNLSGMLEVLLDKHKAGWSTIMGQRGAADFSEPIGWSETHDTNQPQCYCHGGRHEKAQVFDSTQKETWCEWAYVITQTTETMAVLVRAGGEWRLVDVVKLIQKPDWKAIELRGGAIREEA